MFFRKRTKRAFTIIELVVVIAILAIFATLTMPSITGYITKANMARIKTNINVVQSSIGMYYIDNNDWPRMTEPEDYYSKEEMDSYAKEYLNATGEKVTLDPDGHFYNINWEELDDYVKEPKDGFQYILQNPVGKIFYLNEPTKKGEKLIADLKSNADNSEPSKPEEPVEEPETTIVELTTEEANNAGFIFNEQTQFITGYNSIIGGSDVIIPQKINGVEVTGIGKNAFKDKKLNSVSLSNTLMELDNNAFENNNLSSITLPDSIKTIGNYCFRSNSLTSIKLPASLTEINSLAFYNNKLTSITIPKNISLVGSMAFSNNNLTEVVIKGSETRILSNSFNTNGPSKSSNSITEAPFNGTWKLTNDDNYKDWRRLLDLDNPDNHDELTLGEAAAQGFIFNNGIITNYTGNNRDIIIPQKINDIEVTGIGKNAFKDKN